MTYPIITKLGGRRFLLCSFFGVASIILVWNDKITGAEYVAAVSLILGAYFAVNTWQKKNEADQHDQ